MIRRALAILAALAVLAPHSPARAQSAYVVADCAAVSGMALGPNNYLVEDQTGKLCGFGAVIISGTSDVNLKQVNGATVNVGVGAAGTGTQRVTTSTDSTISTVTSLGLAQASTTAAQVGPLLQAAVVSGDQSYTAAQTNPLTLTTTGRLRVGLSSAGSSTGGTAGTNSDLAGAIYNATNPTLTDGQQVGLQVGVNGGLKVGGLVASGSNFAGFPLPVGCDFNTTPPTYTNGQRAQVQCGTRGSLAVQLMVADSQTTIASGGSQSDAQATTTAGVITTRALGYSLNGSTYDRNRTIQGADGTGLGVAAVAVSPNSSANSAITPVVSTTLESCHVLKASAGNLYSLSVVIQATSGIAQVFNATSAPGDGAVTPLWSMPITSNATMGGGSWEWTVPLRASTGLTVCFSSATTPFTKTASATAMFTGGVQ